MFVDVQPHCQIEYLPELRCVVQTWRGYAASAQFRDSIEKTIAFSQTNEITGIISDTRAQDIVAMEDIQWLASQGNPRLFAAGVKRLAFVSPRNPFTGMGESDYAHRTGKDMEIRWFATPELAKTWLEGF